MTEPLLTVLEVAQHYKVKRDRIYVWLRQGLLVASTATPGRKRFTAQDLADFERRSAERFRANNAKRVENARRLFTKPKP